MSQPPLQPPAQPTVGGSTQPQVNTQELGFLVRNWVHYDTLHAGMYRQTINARKVRDEFEVKILETLRVSNMENAVIQIANGRLCVQEERHNQPLTLRRLEEILHAYHISNNKSDDTTNIMKFFKNQRGFEIVKKLKKQSGPALPPLPGPPKS
jgi:hypothetical protein